MMHRKSYGFFVQNFYIPVKLWSKQLLYWKKIKQWNTTISAIQLAKKKKNKISKLKIEQTLKHTLKQQSSTLV